MLFLIWMQGKVFPAYAGVSHIRAALIEIQRGLPRLRGGEPCTAKNILLNAKSSPPTRG